LSKTEGFVPDDFVTTTFQASLSRQESGAAPKNISLHAVTPKMLLFPDVQSACSSVFLQRAINLMVQPIGGRVIVS